MPTKYEKSSLADCVKKFFCFCDEHSLYGCIAKPFGDKSKVAEFYVISLAAIITVGLFLMKYISFYSWAFVIVAIYTLWLHKK